MKPAKLASNQTPRCQPETVEARRHAARKDMSAFILLVRIIFDQWARLCIFAQRFCPIFVAKSFVIDGRTRSAPKPKAATLPGAAASYKFVCAA